ncbi:MAG: DivIVA domain-containing protein [Ignavibacteriae bacterium]|nr:MAG: DivIVA domain-containing protein [Ignavibacteriota bacterium]
MRLSAIDIKKQEFRKTFKGYDVNEVEAYLDTVANEVEKLFKEIEMHTDKIAQLESERDKLSHEIDIYRENEKSFQKAIVKSQDMSEDIMENATKRAELIVKESEIIAQKVKMQAKEEIMNLKQELEELRMKNERIIDDIKNYLEEKLNSVEEYSKNRKIFKLESSISALDDVHEEKHNIISTPSFEIDLNIDESK